MRIEGQSECVINLSRYGEEIEEGGSKRRKKGGKQKGFFATKGDFKNQFESFSFSVAEERLSNKLLDIERRETSAAAKSEKRVQDLSFSLSCVSSALSPMNNMVISRLEVEQNTS